MSSRSFWAPADARRRLLAYALPVLLLALLGGWRLRSASGTFDSWAWQGATYHRQGGARDVMVQDLLHKHLKPGMNRRLVLAMLGEPDDDVDGDWFYLIYQAESPELRYYAQFYDVNLMVTFKGDVLREARVVHPRVVYTEPLPNAAGPPGFMSLE